MNNIAKQATMAEIAARVAAEIGVPVDALISPARHRPLAQARHRAMLAMHMAGVSKYAMARFWRREPHTIRHGIKAAKARAG
jgi:chromosomal replication initiation ATPase DnaA